MARMVPAAVVAGGVVVGIVQAPWGEGAWGGVATPRLPHPTACMASFGDFPSRGNDGLPRDFCAARPSPDLRSRPPGGGTDDRCDARVPGQLAPLRSSAPPPLAAAPGR